MSQILGSVLTGALAGLCFGIHHDSKTIIASDGVMVHMPTTCMLIGGVAGLVIGVYPPTFPFCGYLIYGAVKEVVEIPHNGIIQIFKK